MEIRLEGEGVPDIGGDESVTIESEIIEIVKANNLRHLSAIVTSDGLIKVSVQERKPSRVNGFDHRSYYRKNRERIRKYQHEYYIRTRGETTGLAETSSTKTVMTPGELAVAMANVYTEQGREVNVEEFRSVAEGIIQFFGYDSEVVENHLEEGDRQVMYQLEDIGLVSTRSEETSLMIDGKPWRTHYFVLNRDRIREAASRKTEATDAFSATYGSLPEEAWVR